MVVSVGGAGAVGAAGCGAEGAEGAEGGVGSGSSALDIKLFSALKGSPSPSCRSCKGIAEAVNTVRDKHNSKGNGRMMIDRRENGCSQSVAWLRGEEVYLQTDQDAI